MIPKEATSKKKLVTGRLMTFCATNSSSDICRQRETSVMKRELEKEQNDLKQQEQQDFQQQEQGQARKRRNNRKNAKRKENKSDLEGNSARQGRDHLLWNRHHWEMELGFLSSK